MKWVDSFLSVLQYRNRIGEYDPDVMSFCDKINHPIAFWFENMCSSNSRLDRVVSAWTCKVVSMRAWRLMRRGDRRSISQVRVNVGETPRIVAGKFKLVFCVLCRTPSATVCVFAVHMVERIVTRELRTQSLRKGREWGGMRRHCMSIMQRNLPDRPSRLSCNNPWRMSRKICN